MLADLSDYLAYLSAVVALLGLYWELIRRCKLRGRAREIEWDEKVESDKKSATLIERPSVVKARRSKCLKLCSLGISGNLGVT